LSLPILSILFSLTAFQMPTFLKQVWPIVWKDVVAEFRTRETLLSMCFFAFLTLIIFHFAFVAGHRHATGVLAGMLWVAFVFAGVLGLHQTFGAEKERGSLPGLLLCPVSPAVVYAGKLISAFLFMSMMEALILALFALLFQVNLAPIALPLMLIIVLGTLGFVGVGTMFAAMTINARARELLLPVMLFPIVTPLIIAAVKATETLLNGAPLGGAAGWLRIILAFDLVFFLISCVTFGVVIEE
jgi:heme exporter protein B